MSLEKRSQDIQIAIVLTKCSPNKLGNGDRDILLSEHPLLDSKYSIGAVINLSSTPLALVSFYRCKFDMK